MNLSGSDIARSRMKSVIEDIWAAGNYTNRVTYIEGYVVGKDNTVIDKRRTAIMMRLEGMSKIILLIGFGPEGRLMTTLAPEKYARDAFVVMRSGGNFKKIPDSRSLDLAGNWFDGDEDHVMSGMQRQVDEMHIRMEKMLAGQGRNSIGLNWISSKLKL